MSSQRVIGSKSAVRASKSAPRGSKRPLRGYQEAFRGLPRRRCDREHILDPFWIRKGGPGTSKINEFCKTSYRFCDVGLLSLSRLRDPILELPGPRFRSFLAFKTAETSLGIPFGALQSRSRVLFFGSGSLQEPSKTPPRGLQAAKTAPRALQ